MSNVPELKNLPEKNRWYNALKRVGQRAKLAGPVVNVYQAKDSRGMPIFVDVGSAYPGKSGFTLLIWAEDYDDFSEMLNQLGPSSWISVTGYLSSYNGRPQYDVSDGSISYEWWTNVS
ncbi:MAG: hypothetical protein Q4F23_04850 [Coriobacteriia bacterium]|nr:hypothetical protein [Coriobacteriia bacterium]